MFAVVERLEVDPGGENGGGAGDTAAVVDGRIGSMASAVAEETSLALIQRAGRRLPAWSQSGSAAARCCRAMISLNCSKCCKRTG